MRNAESDRRAKDAQRKAQELSEENKSLRMRALAGDEAVQRLAQRGETLNQMRRQLKARDDELRTLTRKLEEADRAKSMMVDEMEHANKRTNSIERELLSARRDAGDSGRRMGGEESKREVERLEREIEEQKSVIRTLRESSRTGGGGGGGSSSRETYALRQQIGDLKAQLQGVERDKQRLERRAGGGGGTSSREGGLLTEVKKLREQNAGLQKELSAFDLDFFEEIEDLKYKYNAAQQKLRDAGLR